MAPTGIQCTGGKPDPATNPGANPATITGGGLTIPVAKGYQVDARLSKSHAFAEQILVQYKSGGEESGSASSPSVACSSPTASTIWRRAPRSSCSA
ncbi:hypothetical protein G5V59_15380 [Nocardioides sp. W3-2-3]|uniref:hypothetical protein n=1 Tax=Nocardioides convexus TaxID=2712224 RepID=UPI0024186BF3|nr:hypothetical protein [Nocardioides convexus]NHA00841.1 hypothetical protein [Nocardioides convexus]